MKPAIPSAKAASPSRVSLRKKRNETAATDAISARDGIGSQITNDAARTPPSLGEGAGVRLHLKVFLAHLKSQVMKKSSLFLYAALGSVFSDVSAINS